MTIWTDLLDLNSELGLQLAYAVEVSNCELKLEMRTEIINYLLERTEIKIRNYLITEIRIWTENITWEKTEIGIKIEI